MNCRIRGAFLVVGLLGLCGGAFAQGDDLADRVSRLEGVVEDQKETIEQLKAGSNFSVGGLIPVWKNGPRFETADKRHGIKFGGRIHHDWAFFDTNNDIEQNSGKFEDGTEFRRVRFAISGKVYERFVYKIQVDFADGDSDFRDVYIGLTKVPVVGTVTIGQQFEPFGLETLTSSNYITFIERALPAVFAPARNTGVKFMNHCAEQRFTYSAGVFKQVDDFGDGQSDGDYNLSARATGLALYEEDGKKLVHVGFGYSYRNAEGAAAPWRFRSRPEVHLTPRVVDTGSFATDGVHVAGAEVAMVMGPVSAQAEYYDVRAEGVSMSRGRFSGYYVYVSYYLTGEHRQYKRTAGAFTRTKPKQNAFEEDGCGAWEIAARYSKLDLNSGAIQGGELRDYTFGVNWYANPNLRTMLNLVHADAPGGGKANMAVFRFQFDF
ncbi:MAG: porin [Planctomycetota bacterium]